MCKKACEELTLSSEDKKVVQAHVIHAHVIKLYSLTSSVFVLLKKL